MIILFYLFISYLYSTRKIPLAGLGDYGHGKDTVAIGQFMDGFRSFPFYAIG